MLRWVWAITFGLFLGWLVELWESWGLARKRKRARRSRSSEPLTWGFTVGGKPAPCKHPECVARMARTGRARCLER